MTCGIRFSDVVAAFLSQHFIIIEFRFVGVSILTLTLTHVVCCLLDK